MQTQSVCDRGLVARREVSVNQAACNSLGSAVHLPLCGPLWTATRADEKAASVTLLLIWEVEVKCVCVTLSSLSKHSTYMFLLFFCF